MRRDSQLSPARSKLSPLQSKIKNCFALPAPPRYSFPAMTPVEHSDPHLARIAREETAYLARVRPKMRRGRRLMILGGMFLLLILGVLGFRQVWLARAEARLQARIDAIHARGEPVLIEDFTYPDVADEDNSAKDYEAAAALLKKAVPPADFGNADPATGSGGRSATFDIYKAGGDAEFRRKYIATVRQFVADNQPALDRLRAARDKSGADFGVRLQSPLINTTLLAMAGFRELAKTARIAAILAHDDGDDAKALAISHDLMLFGDQIPPAHYSLITALVGIGIQSNAFEGIIETTAFEWRIAEDGPPESDGHIASRASVLHLIDVLLDETKFREGWVRAGFGERATYLDSMNLVISNPAALGAPAPGMQFGAIFPWMFRPLYTDELGTMLDFGNQAVAAFRADDWPTADRLRPSEITDSKPNTQLARPLFSILQPSLTRAFHLQFRTLAMRRMAAVALAIRLYEIDHSRRPQQLSELVPRYLKQIPGDPFTPDNRPIGYAPNADPPRLYCIGVNGLDEGGEFGLRSSGGVDQEARDVPFFLNGAWQPPRPPPSEADPEILEADDAEESDSNPADEAHPDKEPDGRSTDDEQQQRESPAPGEQQPEDGRRGA